MANENLTKIKLDSERADHFVYVDKREIIVLQVQYPIISTLQLQSDNALGIVRLFLKGVSAPFQFTRQTVEEIDELVGQLL